MERFATHPPADVAAVLGGSDVHVWWLPRHRSEGRAPLLAVLSAYVGRSLSAGDLHDDPYGRPALVAARGLDFNWSHSGEHAVVAVARSLPELGVDLERTRRRAKAGELARRFFHPNEAAWLQALDAGERQRAFLALWTAKEAVLKGLGRGVAYGLERVEFAWDGGHPSPSRFTGPAAPATDWQVHRLPLPDTLVDTLAWRGAPRGIGCYRAVAGSHDELPSPRPV